MIARIAALALACACVTEALPVRASDLVEAATRYEGTNPGGWRFPWCAAWIRWVLPQAGLSAPGTNNLASSFLALPRTRPHPGAVAVVHGGAHVAIVKAVTPEGVWLISGNGRGHRVHTGLYRMRDVSAFVEPLPASVAAAVPWPIRHARRHRHHRHHHRRYQA